MKICYLVIAVFITARVCSGEPVKSADVAAQGIQAPTERPLRFLFVSPCVNEAFFNPVKKGMRDAAALLGVKCDFVGTQDVDIPAQAALIRKGLVEGYDGIAVDLIDQNGCDAVLDEARKNGVPVVAFNTDGGANRNLRMSAVCQNLYEAGRTVGLEASGKLPAGCKVLFTQHSKGVSALDDRLRGMREELSKNRIAGEVVITGTTPENAAKVIVKALQSHPEIKGVLATGQADTEGAALAVERNFSGKGYYVAGFDLSPEILRLLKMGVLDFTIDQQPYTQGFYPVVQLALWCRYGIRPSSMDAGATVIRGVDADRAMGLSLEGFR